MVAQALAATYFDGRSAAAHCVALTVHDGVISLAGAGLLRSYPASAARMAEPFAAAPAVLDFSDGARCELTDRAAAPALAAAFGYRKSRIVRWQDRWVGALAALILLIATLAALFAWGIPWGAERLVDAAPVSLDRALGRQTLALLERQQLKPSRLSAQRLEPVAQVFAAIRPADARLPLRLVIRNAPLLGANALALADGTIVMTDAMVLLIFDGKDSLGPLETAQLAGVLAHEIGHVQGRHAIRTIARSSLAMAASASLFGDFSTVAAGAPALLVNLDYSREMEREADRYALALLASHGVSGAPLAALLERMEQQAAHEPGAALPDWLKNSTGFLRSHPPGAERSALLRGAPPP